MQYVRAYRGEFVFHDYGSRRGRDTRNLDVTVDQGGRVSRPGAFTDGTITIQNYEPMTAA